MNKCDEIIDLKYFSEKIKELEKTFSENYKKSFNKMSHHMIEIQNRLYFQLESLSWLQRRLKIKGQLPPLRGWAASPDVLLRLHEHIIRFKPQVIVECGSGASTVVIADALQQNGMGKLFSIEHSDYYGAQTLDTLQAESLKDWVDLRIGDLEPWEGEHLNPTDAGKPSLWYPFSLLNDIQNIDLLWVDGPPGSTCLFSRYPAVPALAEKFSDRIEVWLDDTARQEEKDICESWATNYGFELKLYPLEKGLGRLVRPAAKKNLSDQFNFVPDELAEKFDEKELGFDFQLKEFRNKG